MTLTEYLKKAKESVFPQNTGSFYPERFNAIAKELNEGPLKDIRLGEILEATSGEEVYYTDHGPEHVEKVIERASSLVFINGEILLSYYESYLLLVAIYIHDAGMVGGRSGHEKKTQEIMNWLGAIAGNDVVEKRVIIKIAATHGGRVEGDKDTISRLSREVIHLHNQRVNKTLLAAVLRFADELSDDRTRASRYLLESGKLPKASEVYHQYAKSLHSVLIDHQSHCVILIFELSEIDVSRTYGKGKSEVELLDEIHSRTLKMHYERQYCMRFVGSRLDISTIYVKVNIHNSKNVLVDPIKYEYSLRDLGYPLECKSINELCPELEKKPEWVKAEMDRLKWEVDNV
jgi:hypothetical protein